MAQHSFSSSFNSDPDNGSKSKEVIQSYFIHVILKPKAPLDYLVRRNKLSIEFRITSFKMDVPLSKTKASIKKSFHLKDRICFENVRAKANKDFFRSSISYWLRQSNNDWKVSDCDLSKTQRRKKSKDLFLFSRNLRRQSKRFLINYSKMLNRLENGLT